MASKDAIDTTTIDSNATRNKLLKILNPPELEIYFLLLENGQKRIVEIANRSGLDRRLTMHLVSTLLDKGIVVATFKHPIQFTAVPVEKVLRMFSNSRGGYAKIH
ncbi:MAG: sugar-specific transcriptional regulator TrmB [Candidatus Nitrosomirales archaeon]|jgi:sugar-specific transcriptional regulator TrmB